MVSRLNKVGAIFAALAISLTCAASASQAEEMPADSKPVYDAARAQDLGADERGMRSYIFVLIKTGPKDAEITDPEERAQIFQGHFANMQKLAKTNDLVLAGPMDGENGLRGIFVLASSDMDAAKEMLKGDPTVENGIFELEYHRFYGSAALMEINAIHGKIAKPPLQ